MLRKSACGMKRKVFSGACARPAAGASDRMRATIATVRKGKAKEIIVASSSLCGRPYAIRARSAKAAPQTALWEPEKRRSNEQGPGYRLRLGNLAARSLSQEGAVTGRGDELLPRSSHCAPAQNQCLLYRRP